MSPTNDCILSASQDKQVRLWDLRVNMCQGLMNCPSTPVATFDEQGLIFGVATDSGIVKLYDVRNYDKGPFDTFVLSDEVNSASSFTDIKFSNDGKLMVLVIESRTYVLSAYDGKVLHKFITDATDGSTPCEASFSADNKYLLQGSESKSIKIWSMASGQTVTELKSHAGAPACAKWSPKSVLIASACHALNMWLPDLDSLPDISERAIISSQV
jgi:COMPASS component SWD2